VYTNVQTNPGGVWKGLKAIVVFCDDHAQVENCNSTFHVPQTQPNGTDDMFDNSTGAWMSSANTVVNPQ
jgi:hypothetical protein